MIADPEIKRALHSLKDNAQFKIFTEFLQEALTDQDIANRRGDPPALSRGQGRSQLLAEILEFIEHAQRR